jgi:hypothetical protein
MMIMLTVNASDMPVALACCPCRFKSIKQWANDEAVEALSAIELDMASFSHLTASTARKVRSLNFHSQHTE